MKKPPHLDILKNPYVRNAFFRSLLEESNVLDSNSAKETESKESKNEALPEQPQNSPRSLKDKQFDGYRVRVPLKASKIPDPTSAEVYKGISVWVQSNFMSCLFAYNIISEFGEHEQETEHYIADIILFPLDSASESLIEKKVKGVFEQYQKQNIDEEIARIQKPVSIG